MNASALTTFHNYVQGHNGVVVRHGYQVYSWGSTAESRVVASLAKLSIPIFLKRLKRDSSRNGDDAVSHFSACSLQDAPEAKDACRVIRSERFAAITANATATDAST